MKNLAKLKLLLTFGFLITGIAGCSETSEEINTVPSDPDIVQDTSKYLGANEWPEIVSPVKKDKVLEAKITDLLLSMSTEEKVGQIIQAEIQYTTPEDIKKYHLGSVLNGGGSLPNRNKIATPKEWLGLADAYYAASMDTSDGKVAIPIIWGSDAVHGHNNVIGATIFPHNIGLGATRNANLIREIGRVTALEMRATGIDWTFAPTLAVAQNDRWGRTYESYSENPEVVRAFAGEMVLGLQGIPGSEEFLDVNHVVATAKHFVGDGGTKDGDDRGDTLVPETELRDIHAQGYIPALEAGVQSAMASFSSWNGEKMHGHKYMLTDVLKNRMGLDGLVVGDWNGHGEIPGCTNISCAEAINAGVDLFMAIEDWKLLYENTLVQVNDGIIPMERLDDAVTRILRVKLRAGLFSKGKPSDRGVAGQDGIIGNSDHRAISRQAARESLVMLKNNGNILPLNPKQKILVTGDGADNIGKQTGGWTITWQGTGNVKADFPNGTSIYDGIKQAAEHAGGTVLYSEDGSFDTKPDVAIVVFGEEPYAESQGDIDTLEFEAGDKKSLKLLKKLKAKNIPVVSVFLSGRPLWVNPELNTSDAFVAAWLPGSEGVGVADVIIANEDGTPKFDLSGRLSFSWPKLPTQDFLNLQQVNYDPLFPFGYGLSYNDHSELPALPEDVDGVYVEDETRLNLYVGRPKAPWQIYLDDYSVQQMLSGPYAALPTGALEIRTQDKDVQEDALEATWAGNDNVRVSLVGGQPLDFSEYLTSNSVYTMDIKVDTALPAPLYFGLECGPNCIRKVDISDHVANLVGKGWQNIAIDLSCLANSSDNFKTVTVPFILETKSNTIMSFANIIIKKDTAANVLCNPAQ